MSRHQQRYTRSSASTHALGVGSAAAAIVSPSYTQPNPCKTSDTLKWVAASNGHIPVDAVEIGWCSSSQEPYYLARAACKRINGSICPGFVLKSQKVCVCVPPQISVVCSMVEANPDYEVLVNPRGKEKLSWVLVQSASDPKTLALPKNSLDIGCKNTQGMPIFIGRTCYPFTGDIVPGTIASNGNTQDLTYIEDVINGVHIYNHTQPAVGYEILCLAAEEPTETVKQCYLYDIEYYPAEHSTVEWSQIKLEGASLLNRSPANQQMRPQFSLSCPITFKWEVPHNLATNLEIKGTVPFVYGTKDDHRIHLLSDRFFPSHILPSKHIPTLGFGGFTEYLVHGGRVFDNTANVCPMLKGVFKPTVIVVSDTDNGIKYEQKVTCDGKFTVPPHTELKVEQQGLQVSLEVHFDAKLKLIYSNDCVEDKEIEGVYKHTSITAVIPAVVETDTVP